MLWQGKKQVRGTDALTLSLRPATMQNSIVNQLHKLKRPSIHRNVEGEHEELLAALLDQGADRGIELLRNHTDLTSNILIGAATSSLTQ